RVSGSWTSGIMSLDHGSLDHVSGSWTSGIMSLGNAPLDHVTGSCHWTASRESCLWITRLWITSLWIVSLEHGPRESCLWITRLWITSLWIVPLDRTSGIMSLDHAPLDHVPGDRAIGAHLEITSLNLAKCENY